MLVLCGRDIALLGGKVPFDLKLLAPSSDVEISRAAVAPAASAVDSSVEKLRSSYPELVDASS